MRQNELSQLSIFLTFQTHSTEKSFIVFIIAQYKHQSQKAMNEFQNYIDPLTKKLRELEKEGFNDQYIFHNNQLRSASSQQTYGKDDIKIVQEYRFEGISNPSDMSILYAVQGSDGSKGTIVDAYGTYADDDLENFLKKVADTSKDQL